MLKENDSLVQVKICGLTSMDDVHIIEKYGADYAGMVLYYPKSRRNIDINLAAVLVAQLKKSDIKSVAVVVSPDVSQLETIQNAGFDYIQIHACRAPARTDTRPLRASRPTPASWQTRTRTAAAAPRPVLPHRYARPDAPETAWTQTEAAVPRRSAAAYF